MVEPYYVGLAFVSLAVLGAVVLPRLLADRAISFPMLYVVFGAGVFALPFATPPDPVANPDYAEKLTELVVIVALMGAGLKIDRPFALTNWVSTWRLLAVTMPLTIAATALLGWGVLGLLPASAILLGAVVAPTDPVLASDVQVGPPTAGQDSDVPPEYQEGTIRFALTSEAGFNDGLAFPFTEAAVLVAGAAGVAAVDWTTEWLAFHVVYRIAVGVAVGAVVGYLLAFFVFGQPSTTELARVMEGAEALAATLFAYAITELVHGYGFIAVFVAALTLRHYEWDHDYQEELHDFAVLVERLLMAAVLVLFGGALVGGLLAPLSWLDVAVGLAILLLVRPLAGVLALVGFPIYWPERVVIGTYGIRGVGSFFYLSYALNHATFGTGERLWALVGFIVLASIFVHGSSADLVMSVVDRWREYQDDEEWVPASDT